MNVPKPRDLRISKPPNAFSISGAGATTAIESITMATGESSTRMSRISPDPRSSANFAGEKPSRRTTTSTEPDGTDGSSNRPSVPVSARKLVFVTSTSAFTMAAPTASATLPVRRAGRGSMAVPWAPTIDVVARARAIAVRPREFGSRMRTSSVGVPACGRTRADSERRVLGRPTLILNAVHDRVEMRFDDSSLAGATDHPVTSSTQKKTGFDVIKVQPTTLEGYGMRLEPMTTEHVDALREAASDGRLWELWFTSVPEPDKVSAYIANALDGQAK